MSAPTRCKPDLMQRHHEWWFDGAPADSHVQGFIGNWGGITRPIGRAGELITALAGWGYDETTKRSTTPDGVNQYFRPSPMWREPDRSRKEGRGGDGLTAAVMGIHFDIDVAGPGHAEPDLPPDHDTALAVLDESGFPGIGLILDTGGGLLVAAKFAEPIIVCGADGVFNDALFDETQRMLQRAVEAMRACYWQHGYRCPDIGPTTSVSTPARIMGGIRDKRPKDPTPPHRVKSVRTAAPDGTPLRDRRTMPADVNAWNDRILARLSPPPPPPPPPGTTPVSRSPRPLRPKGITDRDQFPAAVHDAARRLPWADVFGPEWTEATGDQSHVYLKHQASENVWGARWDRRDGGINVYTSTWLGKLGLTRCGDAISPGDWLAARAGLDRSRFIAETANGVRFVDTSHPVLGPLVRELRASGIELDPIPVRANGNTGGLPPAPPLPSSNGTAPAATQNAVVAPGKAVATVDPDDEIVDGELISDSEDGPPFPDWAAVIQVGDTPNPVERQVAPSLVGYAEGFARPRTEEWLIDPVIAARRITTFVAGAKTGKSFLALDVCAAAATGRPILGGDRLRRPVRVLYMDHEMTEDDLFERLEALGYGPDDADLLQQNLWYLSFPLIFRDLSEFERMQVLGEFARDRSIDLVVIDTLSRVFSGGENDADTFRLFFSNAAAFLKRNGVACLILDHTGHDNSRARGSSAKLDGVDVQWILKRGDDNAITISSEDGSRVAWARAKFTIRREDRDGVVRHVIDGRPGWGAGCREAATRLHEDGVPLHATVAQATAILRVADAARRGVPVGEGKAMNRSKLREALKFRVREGWLDPAAVLGELSRRPDPGPVDNQGGEGRTQAGPSDIRHTGPDLGPDAPETPSDQARTQARTQPDPESAGGSGSPPPYRGDPAPGSGPGTTPNDTPNDTPITSHIDADDVALMWAVLTLRPAATDADLAEALACRELDGWAIAATITTARTAPPPDDWRLDPAVLGDCPSAAHVAAGGDD